MRIVVNHLTRMERGYICVAGIDLATGKHIRPVLDRRRLSAALLLRKGGLFDITSVVDLGVTKHVGRAPEMEDYLFDPQKASRLGNLAPDKFWKLIKSVAKNKLSDIFGDVLTQQGRGCAVKMRTGESSLGCLLRTRLPMRLRIDDRFKKTKIRIDITDGLYDVSPSVTDLRFYNDDHETPRRDVVQQVSRRIESGVSVILGLGLTRPWQQPGDTVMRHWLQVNGIHLEDDPGWRDISR